MFKLLDDSRIPLPSGCGIYLGDLTDEQEKKMLEFVRGNAGKILAMDNAAAEDMIKKEIGK